MSDRYPSDGQYANEVPVRVTAGRIEAIVAANS
jgi:hypothetical protein